MYAVCQGKAVNPLPPALAANQCATSHDCAAYNNTVCIDNNHFPSLIGDPGYTCNCAPGFWNNVQNACGYGSGYGFWCPSTNCEGERALHAYAGARDLDMPGICTKAE